MTYLLCYNVEVARTGAGRHPWCVREVCARSVRTCCIRMYNIILIRVPTPVRFTDFGERDRARTSTYYIPVYDINGARRVVRKHLTCQTD